MEFLNEVIKIAKRVDDSEFVREYDIKEHKFMTMEEEKRERIINAALKEFSKGYAVANIDVIVKEAGISKGLIFHYFGTKRGLFLFLLKYTLEIVNTEYTKGVSESRDFLENIRVVSKLKIDLSFRYPLVFKFLMKAYSSIKEVFPEGLPGDLANSSHTVTQQIFQRSNNDKMLFKEDIDSEKAQNIILWTMNGLTDSALRYGDDIDAYKAHYDDMIKEFEEYLQILRKILYR
jgi:Transcriptional regulator